MVQNPEEANDGQNGESNEEDEQEDITEEIANEIQDFLETAEYECPPKEEQY